ncbi:MAG: hypothetical protein R3F14_11575 [Polyangiaceae bacterium]
MARLTPAGEVVFARRFRMPRSKVRAIAVAPGGEAAGRGRLQGKLDAGDGAIVSAAGFDVFLARLDPETGIATKTTRWGDVGSARGRCRRIRAGLCSSPGT